MKYDLENYRSYSKEHYATRDLLHNFEHIERIIKTSSKIIAYGIDEEIDYSLLNFLRCFHGLNKKIQSDLQFRENTIDFLNNLGWSDIEINNGFQSLKRHCKLPERIEEKIIYDSNYIEILGAFGLARAFNSAGTRGQSIEEISWILQDKYYNVIEFQTPYGNKISGSWKKYTEDFLQRLKKEVNWYNSENLQIDIK